MKRIAAVILAIAISLLSPISSLAATQTTYTYSVGEELSQQQGVADLSQLLQIRTLADDQAEMLSLIISEKDLLDVAVAYDQNALYIYCNLLGEKTYSISWNAILNYVQMYTATLYGQAMARQLVNEMKEFIDSGFDMSSLASFNTNTVLSPKEAAAQVESYLPGLGDWVLSVLNRAVTVNGNFTSSTRDAATDKTTIYLTGTDIAALFDAEYMREMLKTSIKQSGETMPDSSLNTYVDQIITLLKDELKAMTILVTENIYSNNNEVVGVDMVMAFSDKASISITLTTTFNKLTTEEGINYSITQVCSGSGINLQLKFEATIQNDIPVQAMAAVLFDGTQYSLTYDVQDTADGYIAHLSVYTRDQAVSIVRPAFSEAPYLRLSASTIANSNDAIVLNKGAALDLLSLSSADIQELSQTAQTNLNKFLTDLIAALPSSVIQLLQEY